jgi:hypothetical protein
MCKESLCPEGRGVYSQSVLLKRTALVAATLTAIAQDASSAYPEGTLRAHLPLQFTTLLLSATIALDPTEARRLTPPSPHHHPARLALFLASASPSLSARAPGRVHGVGALGLSFIVEELSS